MTSTLNCALVSRWAQTASALVFAQRALDAAQHDPVTGLLLRGPWTQAAERWLSQPDATNLSLVLVDLDGLKHTNDTYGHPAGDARLRTAATRISTWLQHRGGVAARFGGDEFAVLTRDLDTAGLAELEEMLDAPLRTQGRRLPGGAAIGAVHLGTEATNTLSEALLLADRLLYAHKHARAE